MKKFFFQSFFILITVVIFGSFSFNCYTTFKHPDVYVESDSTDEYYTHEVTLIDDCSRCHEQEEPYAETYSDIYDDPVYDTNYDWNYYYLTPWWYDESYYYDQIPLSQQEQLEPTRRRDFDRREMPDIQRQGRPSVDRPALAKPTSDSNNSTSPAPSTPPPQQRHERRQTVTRDNIQPSTPTSPPPPKREVRESSSSEETAKSTKKKK